MINYLFTFIDDSMYEDFVSEENSIQSTEIDTIEPDNVYDINNNLIRDEWYVRLRHDTTKDDTLFRFFYRKWRLEKEDEFEWFYFDEVQGRSRKDIYEFEERSGKATRPPCPPEG